MTAKERVTLALAHKEADRIPICDEPWSTTLTRWKEEGMPADATPEDYFNYEIFHIWVNESFQFPVTPLEETEEYTIVRDYDGTIRRNWKKHTSTPELVDFTINSRRAWEEHRERLAMNDSRIAWDWVWRQLKKARSQEKFVVYHAPIGYDKFSSIVGPETLLPALIEDPTWPAEMFMQHAELNINLVEEMLGQGFEFDGAWLYDDMGYRNATFFSPRTYREVLFPVHKRLCDFFHSKGMPVILHSCGRVREFIPMLIEAGFDCLQPLEVKAGMDVLELKKEFGEVLAFMGGIDTRCTGHPDPAVIENEIACKIPFAKQGGGYIYHSDHSVPDTVSLERYLWVLELIKKYGAF